MICTVRSFHPFTELFHIVSLSHYYHPNIETALDDLFSISITYVIGHKEAKSLWCPGCLMSHFLYYCPCCGSKITDYCNLPFFVVEAATTCGISTKAIGSSRYDMNLKEQLKICFQLPSVLPAN